MSHLDAERIVLLALGEESASAEEEDHLASCELCSTELAETGHAVAVGRSTVDDAGLETPPDRVWQRISDELGLDPAASQVDLGKRRRVPRASWLLLAASIVLIVGLGFGAWGLAQSGEPEPVAVAELAAFPEHPNAVGQAEVAEAADGSRELQVTLEADQVDDAYREVWLIRNDVGALVSLGVLEGEAGTFVIPAGLDLSEYSLVDVSVEPFDGDPNHSGDSIVRGELDFA